MLILVRHAEKDDEDDVHLSPQGELRAHCLGPYFAFPMGDFRRPTGIVAMAQHSPRSSDRCFDTVVPTANALRIAVCHHGKTREFDNVIRKCRIRELASAVSSAAPAASSRTLLVCWEHRMLPMLANVLGFDEVVSWGFEPDGGEDDDDCFDCTWVIDGDLLHVFPQFEIVDGSPVYRRPRNLPVRTFAKRRGSGCCCW